MQRQLGTGSRLIQRVTETQGNVPKMAKGGNLPCRAYHLLKKQKKKFSQAQIRKAGGKGGGGGGGNKKAFILSLFLSFHLLFTRPQLFKSWTALSNWFPKILIHYPVDSAIRLLKNWGLIVIESRPRVTAT